MRTSSAASKPYVHPEWSQLLPVVAPAVRGEIQWPSPWLSLTTPMMAPTIHSISLSASTLTGSGYRYRFGSAKNNRARISPCCTLKERCRACQEVPDGEGEIENREYVEAT